MATPTFGFAAAKRAQPLDLQPSIVCGGVVQAMEVDDGASEDSDATVAGEEALPCGSLLLGQTRESTVTAQNLAGAGVVLTAAVTSQPDSRASDGDTEAGSASPSLLHGYAAPKSGLESQTGNHKYVLNSQLCF